MKFGGNPFFCFCACGLLNEREKGRHSFYSYRDRETDIHAIT